MPKKEKAKKPSAEKTTVKRKTVAENRKAFHSYFIEEKIEAGIELTGSEVKSLRAGRANIVDSHARPENGEIYLINADIPLYEKAKTFKHEPRRPRKLLLHKAEIKKLSGMVQRKGYTLAALEIYFNRRGLAKVLLGIAKGKTDHDKRDTEKKRDWQRQKERLMRE